MNNKDYIKNSLELHLFFDRIMKEHSFFLETAFTEKDNELKKIANNFQKTFSDILENVINLANDNVSADFLASNEIVTRNTLDAENKTSVLSGIDIRTNITLRELNLRSGNINVNEQLVSRISNINRQTLPVIQNLINFKNNVLNNVLSCKMYTTNYPLLILHIMNEAKMFYELLDKVERRQPFTNQYLYQQELFWNNIMKEHAQFIRGLLDPTEKDLILTANKYAEEYDKIIRTLGSNPKTSPTDSLNETLNFKNFKLAGLEGILNCKIKSIIIPLLADHVLREANHFIRILKNFNIS